jgi:hypothetical protein
MSALQLFLHQSLCVGFELTVIRYPELVESSLKLNDLTWYSWLGALDSSILLDAILRSRLRFFPLANSLYPPHGAFSDRSIEVVSEFLQR